MGEAVWGEGEGWNSRGSRVKGPLLWRQESPNKRREHQQQADPALQSQVYYLCSAQDGCQSRGPGVTAHWEGSYSQ